MARGNVPHANGLVVADGNEAFLAVVEAHRGDQVRVPRILLNPCRGLRSEQLDPVRVNRSRHNVLVVEGGVNVKHRLVHARHRLQMSACGCLPTFDQTVPSARVQNRPVSIERQAGGLGLMRARTPLHVTRHSGLADRRSQILRLDDLAKF